MRWQRAAGGTMKRRDVLAALRPSDKRVIASIFFTITTAPRRANRVRCDFWCKSMSNSVVAVRNYMETATANPVPGSFCAVDPGTVASRLELVVTTSYAQCALTSDPNERNRSR